MIESIAEMIAGAEAKLAAEDPAEAQRLSQAVTAHIQTHLHVNVVAQEPAMTPEQDPAVITDAKVKEETVH